MSQMNDEEASKVTIITLGCHIGGLFTILFVVRIFPSVTLLPPLPQLEI